MNMHWFVWLAVVNAWVWAFGFAARRHVMGFLWPVFVAGAFFLVMIAQDLCERDRLHIEHICDAPEKGEILHRRMPEDAVRIPQTAPQTVDNPLILKGKEGCGIRRLTRSDVLLEGCAKEKCASAQRPT